MRELERPNGGHPERWRGRSTRLPERDQSQAEPLVAEYRNPISPEVTSGRTSRVLQSEVATRAALPRCLHRPVHLCTGSLTVRDAYDSCLVVGEPHPSVRVVPAGIRVRFRGIDRRCGRALPAPAATVGNAFNSTTKGSSSITGDRWLWSLPALAHLLAGVGGGGQYRPPA